MKLGRGLYVARARSPRTTTVLAQASKRILDGVVSLLSALRFHDLMTQSPFEVWLAIGEKSRLPKQASLELRIVRVSRKALTYGVQDHRNEGVLVRIFTPAKTVADCFRYRNKIGWTLRLRHSETASVNAKQQRMKSGKLPKFAV